MPFSKNRNFVGRAAELKVLRQNLLVKQQCQKMSIVGLGGTGKTQLALHFAYEVYETWLDCSIFWLSALSMESFEQACAKVAKELHILQSTDTKEDVKVLVKQWLSMKSAGRWLLVLDNADDSNILFGPKDGQGIVDFLPKSENGIVVYTTRVQAVAVSLSRNDVIELGPMDHSDAAEFLEKSVIKKELLQAGTAATELLEALAYLPLAIAQATAYLNTNKISITKYLRLLQISEQDVIRVMSREFRDDTRYEGSANAVATTWVVSFKQIRERDAGAAELLAFMSCIEWKAIPRSLLPTMQSESQFEEAIGMLCGYSLLVRREDIQEDDSREEWYDMHRLVHLATRIWIDRYDNRAEVESKAMQHVAAVFPSNDHANQTLWRAYLPHALRLLRATQDCSFKDRSKLCYRIGRCLLADGRPHEAVEWLAECCDLRGELDETDSKRLASQHALARAYEENGQVRKAVELLEHVVTVQEKLLAEDHPSRLASQHALAGAYEENGQVRKAVELLEHVVTVQEKLLAEDHPSRLASQHELAGAYQADKQVQKAVELLEHVVTVQEKLLAEDHPSRLASQHELAGAYQADEQVQKAVELLEHIVVVEKNVLAEDHPSRLASQHELARAYLANRQVHKAVELLEHIVVIQEKLLAEDHPSRLASQHVLARAYRADGQVQKAIELLEHVVTVQEKLLAEDHPSRLAAQHTLAGAYLADRQVHKAVELLEHIVVIKENMLAEDHPSRLASQHTLARAYQADGQVHKAVELLEHVVVVHENVLAEDHPSRLASQHALAIAYQANGQVQRAIKMMGHVVTVEARVLRDDHPSRLLSKKALRDMQVQLASKLDST